MRVALLIVAWNFGDTRHFSQEKTDFPLYGLETGI